MKNGLVNLALSLHCIYFIVSQTVSEEKVMFAEVGGDITLKCADRMASASIWRRKDAIISDRRSINPSLIEMYRFSIVGEMTLGEYHLKICNITLDDFGSYWCELQDDNNLVKEIRVSLRLKVADHTTTRSTSSIHTEKETTEFVKTITTTHTTVESTSLHSEFFTTDKTTILEPEVDSSTETPKSTSIVIGEQKDGSTKSGFPFNDEFWFYGLLVGGLVVVFVLSILCNICINHRCKTSYLNSGKNNETSQQVEQLQNDEYEYINELQMIPTPTIPSSGEIFNFQQASKSNETIFIFPAVVNQAVIKASDVAKSEKIMSTYPNSNEMTSVSSEQSTSKNDPSSKSSSSSERSYLEVVDEVIYLNPYQSIKSMENLSGSYEEKHEYSEPSKIVNGISSPEYEIPKVSSDAALRLVAEEMCIAEVVVKQIESTLKEADKLSISSASSLSLDKLITSSEKKSQNPYVSLEISTENVGHSYSSVTLAFETHLNKSDQVVKHDPSVHLGDESVAKNEESETCDKIADAK